jgi:site-specific DNA-methyltransferase (adenine-specific)
VAPTAAVLCSSTLPDEVLWDPLRTLCLCLRTLVDQRFKRRWIGIDIAYLAIKCSAACEPTSRRELNPYEVVGAPTDVHGAQALKEISPYQFERWAVDLVNARPARDHKKGADSSIDGCISFFDDKTGQAKRV